MSKIELGHWSKQVLLQTMSVRCLDLFGRLEVETFNLDVMDYFDKYYHRLYTLIYAMEHFYPDIDMSTSDVDVLYRRLHMRDEL